MKIKLDVANSLVFILWYSLYALFLQLYTSAEAESSFNCLKLRNTTPEIRLFNLFNHSAKVKGLNLEKVIRKSAKYASLGLLTFSDYSVNILFFKTNSEMKMFYIVVI